MNHPRRQPASYALSLHSSASPPGVSSAEDHCHNRRQSHIGASALTVKTECIHFANDVTATVRTHRTQRRHYQAPAITKPIETSRSITFLLASSASGWRRPICLAGQSRKGPAMPRGRTVRRTSWRWRRGTDAQRWPRRRRQTSGVSEDRVRGAPFRRAAIKGAS